MFLVLLASVVSLCFGSPNATIGTCRDASNILMHGRKTLKSAASDLLSGFVGLVEQYNREFPSHYPDFATWQLGYKSAMFRSYLVLRLNETVNQFHSDVYYVWATLAENTLCSGDDLSELISYFEAIAAADASLKNLKGQYYQDGFSYAGVPFDFGAGAGYSALVQFSNKIVSTLKAQT